MKKGKVLLIAMLVSCFMFAATACGTDDNKNKDDNNVTSEDKNNNDNNDNAKGKSGNNGVIDDIGNDIERGVNDIGNDLSGGAGNSTNGGNANSNVNSVTAGQ